jgi:hypothetical protein
MANSSQAFGLRPVGTDSGAPYSGRLRKYYVPTSVGTAVFPGDPVIINGTSSADANGEIIPQVVLATAAGSNYLTGVVVSVLPLTEADPTYIAANAGGYVLVDDDPFSLFEIMGSTTDAVGDIGNTASLVSGSGSTALGISGWQLDSTTIGTGTQLVIEGVRQQDNNDLTASHPVLLVRINLHQKRNTTGV